MPLYFAYGANMDIADMAARAPHSKPLGLARLPRHRFIIMKEGYASVIRDARFSVHGLLWDLAISDLKPLDRFEGLDRGLYVKINQPVIVEGGAKRALVYVGASAEPGKPRPGYLESILASAAALGLPSAYRKELAGWSGQPAARQNASAPRASGPVAGVTPTRSHPGAAASERATDKWRWEA